MVKLNIYVETTILTEEFYNSTKKEKEKIVNELKKNIFEYIYEKYDFVEIISEEYSIIESIEGPYKKFMPYVKFLGSWKNFEEQNYRCIEYNLVKAREENQRIAELEKECQYYKDEFYSIQIDKDHYSSECYNLQDKIKVLEKALELACASIKEMCPEPMFISGKYGASEVKDKDYFIQQAEKELGDKES